MLSNKWEILRVVGIILCLISMVAISKDYQYWYMPFAVSVLSLLLYLFQHLKKLTGN